ncbi:MAG TPA: hypothetical protein VGG03_07280 [Thermoanaerobaculia bacterium]|jgi:hypothetical protein
MRFRNAIFFLAAAALPALALAAEPVKSAPAEAFHRVELKPAQGAGLPYTIEVPQGWQARQVEGYPGLWIGPADAAPPQDPRLIWVRGSQISLADPDEVAANIKANDEANPQWSAPRVEVREVGGVRGLLVRMDSGEGEGARSSLTLKLPLENLAVDFVASAGRAEFEKRLPTYERILLSVRPARAAK